MRIIESVEQLEELYGTPLETATAKEVDYLTPEYAKLVAASPFVALATVGPEGLDCSPRGDLAGFVRVGDARTLLMPDRRGNNRVDSLRNIVRNPQVALLFLIPGVGSTLRVNGRAKLCIEPELAASFAVDGKSPRCVLVIRIEAVYFQCARAILRSNLWDSTQHVDPKALPTPGEMLASLTNGRVGGGAYDDAWLERAKASMW